MMNNNLYKSIFSPKNASMPSTFLFGNDNDQPLTNDAPDLPDDPSDSKPPALPTKVPTNESHTSTPSSLMLNPVSSVIKLHDFLYNSTK